MAAYSTAIQNRDKTFDKVKAEREGQAAITAFFFSLAAVGAMATSRHVCAIHVRSEPVKVSYDPTIVWWNFTNGLGVSRPESLGGNP